MIIPCIPKSFRPFILPQMTSKPLLTAVKHDINAHTKPAYWREMINSVKPEYRDVAINIDVMT